MISSIISKVEGIDRSNLRLILTTGLLSMLLVGTGAAQDDPSSVVSNAIDDIVSEAAEIGSLLLFAYGFYQLINAGMSDEKSGPLKKVVVSWGLGIIVRSWDDFMGFITSNNVESSATIDGTSQSLNEIATQSPEVILSIQTAATDVLFFIV